MDMMSELFNMVIEEKSEFHAGTPLPHGAFGSFEELRDYVNAHQEETSSKLRVADHYKDIDADSQYAYLRAIEIPKTMCRIYVVCVPQDPRHASIDETMVPPIDTLVHDPEMFGFSEELDQERRLRRPMQFVAWKTSYYDETELRINYQHITTIGVDQKTQYNRWRTFAKKEDAEAYMAEAKLLPSDESPLSSLLGDMLEAASDAACDEFINRYED